jgi:hypothetical protein
MKGSVLDYDPLNVYFWLFAGMLVKLPQLEAAGVQPLTSVSNLSASAATLGIPKRSN